MRARSRCGRRGMTCPVTPCRARATGATGCCAVCRSIFLYSEACVSPSIGLLLPDQQTSEGRIPTSLGRQSEAARRSDSRAGDANQSLATACSVTRFLVGIDSFQFRPSGAKSISTLPARISVTMRPNTTWPKPLLVGRDTRGPPRSSQLICSRRGSVPEVFQSQETVTRPAGEDSAPYLTALVANSCSASPIASAAFGPRNILEPETLRRALPASTNGAS